MATEVRPHDDPLSEVRAMHRELRQRIESVMDELAERFRTFHDLFLERERRADERKQHEFMIQFGESLSKMYDDDTHVILDIHPRGGTKCQTNPDCQRFEADIRHYAEREKEWEARNKAE